jgi:hypothetical protein
METSRRTFVRTLAAAGAGSAIGAPIAAARRMLPGPVPGAGDLVNRFADLQRHFVFE